MRPVRPSLVCDRVRGQISVGLDGELSQLERAMVSSHLERCPSCKQFQSDATAFTRLLREEPLEPLGRSITVQRRRRMVGTRIQVAAAAALAVAALIGAGEALREKPLAPSPAFVPSGTTQIKFPSQQQLEREQAMLSRARVGHPVQLQGQAL